MVLTIGIDIGGTKIASCVLDGDGAVLARDRRATLATNPHAVTEAVGEAVRELVATPGLPGQVEAVGIGAAGYIDASRARVLFAPNLAWRDHPLRDEVERLVDLPVTVENDANAAAWAEFLYGAGRGTSDLAVVTVGTGIGGGIVLGGELYRGRFGIAAEFGHMMMVRDGRRCGCGQRGCWEQYCSGRALLHAAREIADVQPKFGDRLLELGEGEPAGISARDVTNAAAEGDPAAQQCFDEIGYWLGQGIADVVSLLDPQAVVVGGGVTEGAGELLLGSARQTFEAQLSGGRYRPVAEIRPAQLGNDAGMIGAGALARDAL